MQRLHEDRTAFRRATNVSLDQELVAAAKDFDLNVSRACEQGLRAAVSAERKRRWQNATQAATQAYADYLDAHGLPLEQYRQF